MVSPWTPERLNSRAAEPTGSPSAWSTGVPFADGATTLPSVARLASTASRRTKSRPFCRRRWTRNHHCPAKRESASTPPSRASFWAVESAPSQEIAHGKSGSACRFLTLAFLENGCSRPGTPSRTTRRFLTVADASGSLPGACFAARRAEARWPLTTSPLARQDITAAVEGTVWARLQGKNFRAEETEAVVWSFA